MIVSIEMSLYWLLFQNPVDVSVSEQYSKLPIDPEEFQIFFQSFCKGDILPL